MARGLASDLKQLQDREFYLADVDRLAKKWGIGRATLYRKLKRFRECSDLSALLPGRRGQKPGTSSLDPEIEFIVKDCATRLWASSENATVEDIYSEIVRECTARQFSLPSRATVGRRLQRLRTDACSFTGEARKALKEKKRLVKSSYSVTEALAVVQIDHTVADILLVEPQTAQLIGRPTLTIAIDVATRCVLGFCASLEAPSSLLLALCLEMAVFPKTGLSVAANGVHWPMHGLMKSIHSDNGREFHSQSFRRGCDLNSIDTIYRPPATPRFGGHIERLIGTFMRRTRLLPGNTYSDMLRSRPESAETSASLTLSDYRSFLTEEIDRYHSRVHRTLRISPRSAWEKAWKRSRGVETPPVPASRERFLMDFLPIRSRVITREGIEIDGLRYSHECLQSEINPAVKRFIRFDPRDISHVYLETEAGPYVPIPLRAQEALPSMSWWEWKAMRRNRAGTGASSHLSSATSLRANRARARRAEWQAIQAIEAMPVPNTRLNPVVRSESELLTLDWEILD